MLFEIVLVFYGRVDVHSINGVHFGNYPLTQGNNTIDLGKTIHSSGIYSYQISVADEVKKRDKLVILN